MFHDTGVNTKGSEEPGYATADAARLIGVSTSGLRRLAHIYERVYGALPRDSRLGRVWPTEAIERLNDARQVVQAGRAVSIEQALLNRGAIDAPATVGSVTQRASSGPEALEELANELHALREAIEKQNQLLTEQGQQLETLQKESRTPLRSNLSDAMRPWIYALIAVLAALFFSYGFMAGAGRL
jgi:signal transduction histidine kinase